jgi:hypothetical protein
MDSRNELRRGSVPAVDPPEGEILKESDSIELSPVPSPEHAIDVLSPIHEQEQRGVIADNVTRPNRWINHGHTRTSSKLSDSSISNASSNGSTSFTVMPNTFYTTTPLTFAGYQQQSRFAPSAPGTAPVTTSGPRTRLNESQRSGDDQKSLGNPLTRTSNPKHFVFPKDRYPSNPVSRNTEPSRSDLETITLATRKKDQAKSSPEPLRSTSPAVQAQSTASDAIMSSKALHVKELTQDSVLPTIAQSMFGGAIYGYSFCDASKLPRGCRAELPER